MKQRRLSEIGISVAGLAEELRRDRSVIHWRIKALRIPTFKPESTEGRPWGQPLKKLEGAPLNLG